MAYVKALVAAEEDSIQDVALSSSIFASHCDHMQVGGRQSA